jgi:hypothetical protein
MNTPYALTAHELQSLTPDLRLSRSQGQSRGLLYDWRFTANQFIFVLSLKGSRPETYFAAQLLRS